MFNISQFCYKKSHANNVKNGLSNFKKFLKPCTTKDISTHPELTRDRYIFNKCGTNIYFFTLQRFGPSPSLNFKYSVSLLTCFILLFYFKELNRIHRKKKVLK